MKQLITFIFCLFCTYTLLSQSRIKGRVLDETQAPIAYANVSIHNPNDSILAGGITDDKGRFDLSDLPSGTLTLRVQYLGYGTLEQSITTADNILTLGNLLLLPIGLALDEVVVTTERSEYRQQLDRRIFNVGKDVASEGGNALELLNEVPQVAVEPSGTVSLRGSTQVQILINGRRSGLTVNNALDQLDAENIDRIEVITNPSASFDANGSAGIINIVLKKNRDFGLKGQISLTAGTPANHIVRPSILYKTPRLNLFANYRWRYSDYNGNYTSTQRNFNEDAAFQQLDKNEIEDRHDDGRSFYLGGDYTLNDRNTLTLAFFRADTKDTDFTRLDYQQLANNTPSTILRQGDIVEQRDYNQLEANFTRTYEQSGQEWRVDFQYDFWNSTKNWLLNTTGEQLLDIFPTDLRTRSIAGSDDYVLSTDYQLPLGEKGQLQFGAKWENRLVNNDYLAEIRPEEQWQTYLELDNAVDYAENISAAYLQYAKHWDSWNMQLGLRAEHTMIGLKDRENQFTQDKRYLNLFPSAFLGYAISEQSDVQFSYSRRIQRPSLWLLYPFAEIRDLNLLDTGNPELDPTYTDALELNYSYRQEKFSLHPGLFVRFSQQPILNFLEQTSLELFTLVPVNIDGLTETGIELTAQYQPSTAIRLSADGNLYRFQNQGSFAGQYLSNTGTSWRARVRANFRFPANLRAGASFMYFGPQREAQFYYYGSSDLSANISKTFFDDKLEVAIRAMNILNSRARRAEVITADYTLDSSRNRVRDRYQITLVYKFNQTERDRMRYENRGNR